MNDILATILNSLMKNKLTCYHSPDNKLFLDPAYRSCVLDLNSVGITIEDVKQYGVSVIDPSTIVNN